MANFTQKELALIASAFKNIEDRMQDNSAINPDDKPIADGYAMMANLLKNRLNSDNTLTATERENMNYVMTWFKVNRGIGSFSTLI